MARPRKTETQMLIATDTGAVDIDGVTYHFTRDVTRVDSDSAIAKAIPQFFKPMTAHFPRVEQATAAPGEVRGETD